MEVGFLVDHNSVLAVRSLAAEEDTGFDLAGKEVLLQCQSLRPTFCRRVDTHVLLHKVADILDYTPWRVEVNS